MNNFNPLIEVSDDGLCTPVVRQWSERKYNLVGRYCDIFTTSMRKKWHQLVYIDLFAGAGYAKIEESGKIFKSSALLALSIPVPFDTYIFCEQDKERFYALKARVERDFPEKNVIFFHGNSNEIIHKVKAAIPPFGKGNLMLPFCFVDPFSLNLHFRTIQALSSTLMDFLILHALHMDANRNLEKYLAEQNEVISNYLDNPNWRAEYEEFSKNDKGKFVLFLAEQYKKRMIGMNFVEPKLHLVKSNVKKLPLYYLGFYSKHQLGIQFFEVIEQASTRQYTLF